MWATPPVITARSCLPQPLRSCTAPVGTIRRMSVITGMEHPTPTESAWPLHGVRGLVGASRLVSATPTVIPTITRGGGRGATTELAAGDQPGDMATAATRARTY